MAANRAVLSELSLDPREVARQLAIQEHEAAEIAAAKLRPGEADEIRARLDAAQHGEAIARAGDELHESLIGEPGGARESVAQALRSARQLGRLDPRFEPLADGWQASRRRSATSPTRRARWSRAWITIRGSCAPGGAAVAHLRAGAPVRR